MIIAAWIVLVPSAFIAILLLLKFFFASLNYLGVFLLIVAIAGTAWSAQTLWG